MCFSIFYKCIAKLLFLALTIAVMEGKQNTRSPRILSLSFILIYCFIEDILINESDNYELRVCSCNSRCFLSLTILKFADALDAFNTT